MQITIYADTILEMKKACKEFLLLCEKTQYAKYVGIRTKKKFTEDEISKMVSWTRQGKKPKWIAIQMERTPIQISAKLAILRKLGYIPKPGNLPGRVKIREEDEDKIL